MQLPVVSVVTEMAVELVCRAAERLLESLRARRRRAAVRACGACRAGAVVLVLVVTHDAARQWGAGR